jgi:hypothetical protein
MVGLHLDNTANLVKFQRILDKEHVDVVEVRDAEIFFIIPLLTQKITNGDAPRELWAMAPSLGLFTVAEADIGGYRLEDFGKGSQSRSLDLSRYRVV